MSEGRDRGRGEGGGVTINAGVGVASNDGRAEVERARLAKRAERAAKRAERAAKAIIRERGFGQAKRSRRERSKPKL